MSQRGKEAEQELSKAKPHALAIEKFVVEPLRLVAQPDPR
jgi:hypothetical protein